jgi:hypothetical protein
LKPAKTVWKEQPSSVAASSVQQLSVVSRSKRIFLRFVKYIFLSSLFLLVKLRDGVVERR